MEEMVEIDGVFDFCNRLSKIGDKSVIIEVPGLKRVYENYNAAFGGCKCNRKRRQQRAERVFKEILELLEKEHLLKLRDKVINSEKVLVKFFDNSILKF